MHLAFNNHWLGKWNSQKTANYTCVIRSQNLNCPICIFCAESSFGSKVLQQTEVVLKYTHCFSLISLICRSKWNCMIEMWFSGCSLEQPCCLITGMVSSPWQHQSTMATKPELNVTAKGKDLFDCTKIKLKKLTSPQESLNLISWEETFHNSFRESYRSQVNIKIRLLHIHSLQKLAVTRQASESDTFILCLTSS